MIWHAPEYLCELVSIRVIPKTQVIQSGASVSAQVIWWLCIVAAPRQILEITYLIAINILNGMLQVSIQDVDVVHVINISFSNQITKAI